MRQCASGESGPEGRRARRDGWPPGQCGRFAWDPPAAAFGAERCSPARRRFPASTRARNRAVERSQNLRPDRVHGGAGGELAADHGVVDSLRGESVDKSTGIAGQQHSIGVGARQRSRDRQRKCLEIGAVRSPREQVLRLQIVHEGLVVRVMLAAQIRQIIIQFETDADVQVTRLRKHVAVAIVAANPVINVHAVPLSRAQLLVRRLLHHVDGVIALDAAGAEPGGACDDAVRAIAADDHARVVLVSVGDDVHGIGMNRHFASQSGCHLDVRPGKREQQIVELAPPDHQIQTIGRSVIDHKTGRRFEMDFAHPARGDVASASVRYGKRARARALIPPPQALSRGNALLSSNSVETPASPRILAAVAPAGPAPATMTSKIVTHH